MHRKLRNADCARPRSDWLMYSLPSICPASTAFVTPAVASVYFGLTHTLIRTHSLAHPTQKDTAHHL